MHIFSKSLLSTLNMETSIHLKLLVSCFGKKNLGQLLEVIILGTTDIWPSPQNSAAQKNHVLFLTVLCVHWAVLLISSGSFMGLQSGKV